MPRNRFPDSPEKRALRQRDARSLRDLVDLVGRHLDYCGMPSVEFVYVDARRDSRRIVVAVEYDADVANDMRIERDRRQFPFPVAIVEADVTQYLKRTADLFDVFNLDFYTGFVNPTQNAGAKSI